MTLDEGRRLLDDLARRWRRRTQLVRALAVLAAGLPLTATLAASGALRWPVLAAALGLGLVVALVHQARRRPPLSHQLARHLDRAVPQLEESCELLLHGPRPPALLERLQRRRVLAALAEVDPAVVLPWRPVATAAKWLVLGLAASTALWLWTPAPASDAVEVASENATKLASEAGDGPALSALDVAVEPPAYTGRPPRSTSSLDVEAEEGARVTWTVRAAAGVDRATLVFDHAVLELAPEAQDTAAFSAALTAEAPRLYYLRLERAGEEVLRTPYARLEVIADAPPALEVLEPEPFVEVDPGPDSEDLGHLELRVEASDDYGLTETLIRATLATGSGERVQFREQRFDFDSRQRLSPQTVRLGRTLDLKALGVAPGAEFFFFVEAFDNRHPERNRSRTATHIVRVPGGSGMTVGLGDGIPIVTLPEYFRSQRQIILDTEKLIAERGEVTAGELERRAQNLGIDQGALRLRYGVLLGLEFEDGVPLGEGEEADREHDDEGPGDAEEAAGHDHETEEIEFESEAVARVVEELPEGTVHSHDSIENATFFTSQVKSLLKAAIAQMWDAELHLRLYDPEKALPFEYRALRLLKRVQQAERVYVQRIGFEAPVVKPRERRLTGDLEGIESQRRRFATEMSPPLPEVRRALEIAAAWRRAPAAPADFNAVMEAAARILARRALDDPGFDLAALDHLRSWIVTREASPRQLTAVEQALWRLLPEPPARPARRQAAADALYESYRRRLGDGG